MEFCKEFCKKLCRTFGTSFFKFYKKQFGQAKNPTHSFPVLFQIYQNDIGPSNGGMIE
jgi:hypothetical protein